MEILLVVSVLASLYLFNWLYLAPKRLYDHYYRVLTAKGYKVYAPGFNPFGAPIFERLIKDVAKHKDTFHTFKYDLPGYDVVLTNMSNHIELGIINPKLAQSFTNVESLMTVEKDPTFFGLLKSVTPNGLLFLEGNDWKCRRKMMSKVFNHNFLMSHIPDIAKICDEMLDKEEKKAAQRGENGEKIKMDLDTMLSSAFGKVVVSLFLGTDFEEATVEGLPLEEAMKEMSSLSMTLCFNPIVIIFGAAATKFNFNEDCRRFNKLKAGVKTVLRQFVSKIVEEKKSQKQQGQTQDNLIGNLIDKLGDTPNFE